ncbi:MAG: caspase family protein [Saprospiraceae bacterium]
MNEIADIAKYLPKDSLDYQRLVAFHTMAQKRGYGKGHLWFACFAAFPVFLTPDLLYKLWLNFRTINLKYGRTDHIDRMAVSDLLLSNLIEEVAIEVYAIRQPIRTALLGLLENWSPYLSTPENPTKQLADFVLRYIRSYQMEGESVTTAVREAQEWNAMAYFNPGAAAMELKKALSQAVSQQAKQKLLRISLLLQQMDQQYTQLDHQEQHAQFRTLVNYSQGMQAFIHGHYDKALETFRELPSTGPSTGNATGTQAVRLPIPKQIYQEIAAEQQKRPEKAYRLFATLVGIDQHRPESNIPHLQGAVNDAQSWRDYLNERFEGKAQIHLLQNGAATKQAVWSALEQQCKKAKAGDHLLFFFAGHGQNKADGIDRNTIILYDFAPSEEAGGRISEDDFRSFTDKHIPTGVSFTLILDTHAGSAGWLDIRQTDRFIYSACTDLERANELNKSGLFTSAMLQVFSDIGQQPISHQALIRKTRAAIHLMHTGNTQTPVVFGNPTQFHQAFLFTADWEDLQFREFLVDNGFMRRVAEKNKEEAIQQFRKGWPEVEGLDLETALVHQYLVGSAKELRVFISQSNDNFNFSSYLEKILDKRGLPYDIYKHNLWQEQKINMQKYVPIQENSWEDKLQEAQWVFILLEPEWLTDQASLELVRQVQIRKMAIDLPVSILMVETCEWPTHLVSQLGNPWPAAPIVDNYKEEEAFVNDLEAFLNVTLRYFKPFFKANSAPVDFVIYKSQFTDQLLDILGAFYPNEVANLEKEASALDIAKKRHEFIAAYFPYPIGIYLAKLLGTDQPADQLFFTHDTYQASIRLLNTILIGLLQQGLAFQQPTAPITDLLAKGLQQPNWLSGTTSTGDLLNGLAGLTGPLSFFEQDDSLKALIRSPQLPVLADVESVSDAEAIDPALYNRPILHNYRTLIDWFKRVSFLFGKSIVAVGEVISPQQGGDYIQSSISFGLTISEQKEETTTPMHPQTVYFRHSTSLLQMELVEIAFLYTSDSSKVAFDELVQFLSPLQTKGLILIKGFDITKDAVNRQNMADISIVACLINPAFLFFFFEEESLNGNLDFLLREKRVLPIIQNPSLFETTAFSDIAPLPSNKKPISVWSSKEEAYLEIAISIKKLAESIQFQRNLENGLLELSPFIFNNYHFNQPAHSNSLFQFNYYEESQQWIHFRGLTEDTNLSIGPNAGVHQPFWLRFQTFWNDLRAGQVAAETISPTVWQRLLANLGRTEQVEQFAITLRGLKLPYQIFLLPAPTQSAPKHALLQLKSAFEEVIKDNYFVFDTVSFAAKEGLEGIKRHLPNMLKKWRNLKTPPNTASVLALIHFEGDWYAHRTGLINWLQSEAEKLFDFPFKQTIVAIALDLPEAPNAGSFQKVFRRNNADEQIGWLRNVAKSFDAVTLLPSLGRLSWEDINIWLIRNEAELRHLFPEWPAADVFRKQFRETEEGYDMEVVLEVLEKKLKPPNDSATQKTF